MAFGGDSAWEKKGLRFLREGSERKATKGNVTALQQYIKSNKKQLRSNNNYWEELPLHRAAENLRGEHGLEIVKLLLQAFRDGASWRNRDGRLPLHGAVSRTDKHGIEVVKLLLAAYPDGAFESGRNCNLPLWHATEGCDAAIVALLLAANPGAARVSDLNQQDLPLHTAAVNAHGEGGVAVIVALLSAYPEAAQQKNSAGRLPLHVAAAWQTGKHGAAVVSAILAAHPEAVREKDKKGWLPLHCAAAYRHAEDCTVYNVILSAFPEAVREKTAGAEPSAGTDKRGFDLNEGYSTGALPLHIAAGHQRGAAAIDVVKALIAAYPEAVQETNDDGALPLHCAAEHQDFSQDVATVKALLSGQPVAAQAVAETTAACAPPAGPPPAKKKKAAAAAAAAAAKRYGADAIPIAQALFEAFPQGAQQKNKQGKLPIELVKGPRQPTGFGPIDKLYDLLAATMPQ